MIHRARRTALVALVAMIGVLVVATGGVSAAATAPRADCPAPALCLYDGDGQVLSPTPAFDDHLDLAQPVFAEQATNATNIAVVLYSSPPMGCLSPGGQRIEPHETVQVGYSVAAFCFEWLF